MNIRRFQFLIAIAASLISTTSASALPICGRDEVFDLSNFEPLPFGGEILGATIAEGRIIGTHFEITFTTSGQFNAADLGLTLIMPIQPESLGVATLGFTGADAGWSGQGTFTYSIDTNDLNGILALDGDPIAFWFIGVSNLNPANGPISGNFDVWRYEMRFADCPPGDSNCSAAVNPADIPAFVEALLDPDAYATHHPDCSISTADVNADGEVNGRDVRAFTALLD